MMKIQQYLKSHTFLKEDAIFIADSHYSKNNEDLYTLLLDIKNEKIITSQIFLVGDIFHLLLNFEYLKNYNQKIIDLINELSLTKEIIYFEGNHDFCLKDIFCKNITILKELKVEGLCINHGDIYVKDKFYRFYVKIIRNQTIMNIVNFISLNFINNWMFKKLLSKKVKCSEMKCFKSLAKQKLDFYNDCDFIIEGHYHQNKIYKNYVNLPSLYCQNSFLQLKNGKFIEIFI